MISIELKKTKEIRMRFESEGKKWSGDVGRGVTLGFRNRHSRGVRVLEIEEEVERERRERKALMGTKREERRGEKSEAWAS